MPRLLITAIFSFHINAWAQSPQIYEVKQDTTLYTLPGYDYETYKKKEGQFASLERMGMGSLIPKRVAWPKKGDQVEVVSEIRKPLEGSPVIFYEVRIKRGDQTLRGYARADFFIPMSSPSKKPGLLPSPCPSQSCHPQKNATQTQVKELHDAISTLGDVAVGDPLFNPKGCFSENRRVADQCTHPDWLEMSLEDRGKFIFGKAKKLIEAHDLDFTPAMVTCKAVRESCLRPHDQAPGRQSSAAGLSQVTKSTLKDLARRGRWFTPRSTLPKANAASLNQPLKYFDSVMAKSPVAQIEVGLAVLQQKAMDYKLDPKKHTPTILRRYYGHPSARETNTYAQAIMACTSCIQGQKNQVSESCLLRARSTCGDGGRSR